MNDQTPWAAAAEAIRTRLLIPFDSFKRESIANIVRDALERHASDLRTENERLAMKVALIESYAVVLESNMPTDELVERIVKEIRHRLGVADTPPSAVVPPHWKGCPCLYTTPCHPDCTCVNPVSSVGCLRCCTYGSDMQKKEKAEWLAAVVPAADVEPLVAAIEIELRRLAYLSDESNRGFVEAMKLNPWAESNNELEAALSAYRSKHPKPEPQP